MHILEAMSGVVMFCLAATSVYRLVASHEGMDFVDVGIEAAISLAVVVGGLCAIGYAVA